MSALYLIPVTLGDVEHIKSIGSAISFRLFSAKILLLRNQLSIVY